MKDETASGESGGRGKEEFKSCARRAELAASAESSSRTSRMNLIGCDITRVFQTTRRDTDGLPELVRDVSTPSYLESDQLSPPKSVS